MINLEQKYISSVNDNDSMSMFYIYILFMLRSDLFLCISDEGRFTFIIHHFEWIISKISQFLNIKYKEKESLT